MNDTSQLNRFTLVALLMITLVVGVSTAQADMITTITPTGVTLNASSEFFPVSRLIDNSGLTGPPFDASSTHGGASSIRSWVTNGSGPDYFASGTVPIMTFDLGGTFLLDDAIIWNYGIPDNGNQARNITISFSTTGIAGTFSNDVNIVLTLVSSGGIFPAEIATFAPVSANAVRFTITDNFFGIAGSGGDRVGLSEVKFGTAAAVPEPSSMILFGMGLVGLACRRLRRRPA